MKLNPYQNNLLVLIQMLYGIAAIILLVFVSKLCRTLLWQWSNICSERQADCLIIAVMPLIRRDADGNRLVLRYCRSIYAPQRKEPPWHSQIGLLSPPLLFCSPALEIISVLFRAGTVSPCVLSHCGIAPLNGPCLKAQGKKPGLLCVWSQEHSASCTELFSSFLSLSAASGKLPPSSLAVISHSAADPRDLLCWEAFSPLLRSQDLLRWVLALFSASPPQTEES